VQGARRGKNRLAGLVLVTTVEAVAFALVYFLSVHTVRGRLVSDASLRGAISSGSTVQDTVDAVLDVVSVGSLLGAVAVVALIALVRLDRVRGLAAIAVLCTANVATWFLKERLLTRPDLGLDEVAPATLNSLPSGHATAAFSAVAALLVVLPARWRAVAALLGGGYATATALATMLAGWHRAVDSIAAFLVVGICTVTVSASMLVLRVSRPQAPAGIAFRWWMASAVGTLVLGGVLSVALAELNPVRTTVVGSLLAFLSSGLLIIGTMLAVLVSMLQALQIADGTEPRVRPIPTGHPQPPHEPHGRSSDGARTV
jgi:membrane-associated phospholipid phosphatase